MMTVHLYELLQSVRRVAWLAVFLSLGLSGWLHHSHAHTLHATRAQPPGEAAGPLPNPARVQPFDERLGGADEPEAAAEALRVLAQ